MFDCRCIPNPGRLPEYADLTGQNQPVQTYLEERPETSRFRAGVISLIEQSVEAYLDRGFAHLMVNFGCTGGQHRSVFFAEQLAAHLRGKYPVQVVLSHRDMPITGERS